MNLNEGIVESQLANMSLRLLQQPNVPEWKESQKSGATGWWFQMIALIQARLCVPLQPTSANHFQVTGYSELEETHRDQVQLLREQPIWGLNPQCGTWHFQYHALFLHGELPLQQFFQAFEDALWDAGKGAYWV